MFLFEKRASSVTVTSYTFLFLFRDAHTSPSSFPARLRYYSNYRLT